MQKIKIFNIYVILFAWALHWKYLILHVNLYDGNTNNKNKRIKGQ